MKKFDTLLVQIGIAIVPLFFLPITRDFFDYNKHILLIALALIVIVVYAVKSIREKKLTIVVSPLDKAVGLLALAYIVSLFRPFMGGNTNVVEALLQPAGAATVISLTVLYFFVRQLVSFKDRSIFITPFLISGVILTLYMVLQATGLFAQLPIPAVFQIRTLTPAGSLLVTSFYLGVVALVAAHDVFFTNKENKKAMMVKGGLFLVVLIGFLMSVYTLMQENTRPALLPHSASWSIMASAYQIPSVAAIGAGPNNYLNAFTLGRPQELNQTDVWNIRFNTGSNYYLHTATELGIVGILSLLLVTYMVFKRRKYGLGALATLATMLLFPHSIVTLFMLFVFLAYIAAQESKRYTFPQPATHERDALARALGVESSASFAPYLAIGLGVILIAAAGFGAFQTVRAYAAELSMTQGIQSAATPNNQDTYDLQLGAIQQQDDAGQTNWMANPYASDYRIIFSRTNLALANLIAGKEELTETDQQTITQLVTQSVDNGKIAIQLKPSVVTWENLAIIYTNLIGAAQGADLWTVQSYAQAIALDPTNPLLRLSLGQVFYSLQLFDQSSRQFEIAVNLKPDHANSWYNLANAQRQLGNIEAARNSYSQALANLEQGTPDYDLALAELNALPSPAELVPGQLPPLQELQGPEASTEADIETEVELEEEVVEPDVDLTEEEQVEATESGGFLIDELNEQEEETPTEAPPAQ